MEKCQNSWDILEEIKSQVDQTQKWWKTKIETSAEDTKIAAMISQNEGFQKATHNAKPLLPFVNQTTLSNDKLVPIQQI